MPLDHVGKPLDALFHRQRRRVTTHVRTHPSRMQREHLTDRGFASLAWKPRTRELSAALLARYSSQSPFSFRATEPIFDDMNAAVTCQPRPVIPWRAQARGRVRPCGAVRGADDESRLSQCHAVHPFLAVEADARPSTVS
jgi:hypothetical protein